MKVPVLLDTDIGDDIDDALALALVLSSPELDLRGVTTVAGDAHTRALIICRLLHAVGRDEVPVAAGRPAQDAPDYHGQLQYGLRPCFRKRPVKESAVDFLYAQLKTRPGELTLLAIGPLTNVAALLTKHPDSKPWIKRIVLMGGALKVGYDGKAITEPEWNVKSDVKAAQVVFTAGVPLVVAPLDATATLVLEESSLRQVFRSATPLTNQLEALHQLGDKPAPILFDPVAAALCFEEKFCRLEELCLEVDDQGFTRVGKGKPNARVALATRRDDFLKWYIARLSAEPPDQAAPAKPANISAPVARGGLPNRVHVVEDYETDIERRWWLCGQLETKNLPPGSRRACRGVLTNDFDDRLGDARAMYTAVIYNPVPGPPMGPNTRLSFRCWLQGTDTLRVQIYSLTNGYHRHLTLTGLPQGKWQSLTVAMTAARRPDGSGGPLAENERIDDLQFYTDRTAELLIDDLVLHDAAPRAEQRPFPRRVLFTGWFDTGRQGKEWPGTFDIVNQDKPRTGKAAQAVAHPELGVPWLRLHLRGDRPLGETTHLRFRYRLAGADTMTVRLMNRTLKDAHVIELKDLKQGQWAEVVLDFSRDSRGGDGSAGQPRPHDRVDEIQFMLPRGAELLLDDVLLYEPGE
jgi:inosine-uridine nucleoside N-ribohydrolase